MGATGSRRGIASLVEQHYESLYRYAYRLSGTSADAEDLTQDSFCKAQAQLSQLRDPDRAKPWLFSILRNTYLQRARTDRSSSAGIARHGRRYRVRRSAGGSGNRAGTTAIRPERTAGRISDAGDLVLFRGHELS